MDNSAKNDSRNGKNEDTLKTNENISDNLDTIAFYLLEAIQRKSDYQSQKKGA